MQLSLAQGPTTDLIRAVVVTSIAPAQCAHPGARTATGQRMVTAFARCGRKRAGSLVAAVLDAVCAAKQIDPPVTLGRDGQLAYVAGPRGDRVVDFSSAGFRGGGVSLPDRKSVV
jgi:hypothetical protein